MQFILFSMPAWVSQVYLIANFHFTLSGAISCCIFNTLRLPCITASKVFRGLPLTRCLSTIISFHFFTQLSLSILSICPNHHVCSSLCFPTPGNPSTQKTFYPSMSHYTSTIPCCDSLHLYMKKGRPKYK